MGCVRREINEDFLVVAVVVAVVAVAVFFYECFVTLINFTFSGNRE